MSYLALDLGAGSGRAIVGRIDNGKLSLEEIHRFENPPIQLGNVLYWDFLSLFANIKKGISLAIKKGYDLNGLAVDTWGVDFGLIDSKGNLLSNPVCYRDTRTDGLADKSSEYISQKELYSITGIQNMDINSIFQLWSMHIEESDLTPIADKLLFMPDLINYFLTGIAVNEYTIASTSQMLDAQEKVWSEDIFKKLSLPTSLIQPVMKPGTILGKLSKAIAEEIGTDRINVFAVGSHDTASAIGAIPDDDNDWAFLSSGTWSLLGAATDQPILTEEARKGNFTNEGGVDNKTLFMRNMTGLWLLQRLISEWEDEGLNTSYEYLLSESSKTKAFRCIVNTDDPAFTHPISMTKAIQRYCFETKQDVPYTQGELVRCVLESLAIKYRNVMEALKACTLKNFSKLHIVGGGSQNEQLNQFIADSLNITVITGLTEATAIGNIMQQAIADKKLTGWTEAYHLIKDSFSFKTYHPQDTEIWNIAATKTKHLFD